MLFTAYRFNSTLCNLFFRGRCWKGSRQINYEKLQEVMNFLRFHGIPSNLRITDKRFFYEDNLPAWETAPYIDKLLNIKKGDEFTAYHTQYGRSYSDLHYIHFIGERKNKKGKPSLSQYFGLIYFFVKDQESRQELSDLVRQQNSNL